MFPWEIIRVIILIWKCTLTGIDGVLEGILGLLSKINHVPPPHHKNKNPHSYKKKKKYCTFISTATSFSKVGSGEQR